MVDYKLRVRVSLLLLVQSLIVAIPIQLLITTRTCAQAAKLRLSLHYLSLDYRHNDRKSYNYTIVLKIYK